jgi:hypothetical protein
MSSLVMIPLQVASFSLESTWSHHFPSEETARHHCWLATHRKGDMGHLQRLENATRLVNKSTK